LPSDGPPTKDEQFRELLKAAAEKKALPEMHGIFYLYPNREANRKNKSFPRCWCAARAAWGCVAEQLKQESLCGFHVTAWANEHKMQMPEVPKEDRRI